MEMPSEEIAGTAVERLEDLGGGLTRIHYTACFRDGSRQPQYVDFRGKPTDEEVACAVCYDVHLM